MIRMGMIGCGSMSGSHLAALQPLESRMRFTAFADIDVARAERAAALVPGALAVADYHAMLDAVDAVVIAVPHDLHYRLGLDCLQAGKHVMMEKPLALTEAECRELIAADRSPHPVLMLGYVMRHDPLWRQFGDYLRTEAFGQVFHVSIWTEQFTDTTRGAWIGQASRLGGGQLFSHGCHYIDLLLNWLGNPVCGTHIGTNRGTPWMEREGTSDVSLKFASGATAYHFGTWGARGSRLRYAVHAHCTEGMLELDHAAGTITLHRSRTDGDLPAMSALAAPGESPDEPNRAVVYRRPGQGGKAVVQQMEAFLDCIEQQRKPTVSAAASLRSLQVIWKLYEAEERMQVADLRGI
ncbi:MAG: Gfo/Idh/MocA family oxidoreductase [Lentisphaerae bacterium]|nr:Gfo/Idh/MocA family oxidoreductase [Lentisphaerota bacterium]